MQEKEGGERRAQRASVETEGQESADSERGNREHPGLGWWLPEGSRGGREGSKGGPANPFLGPLRLSLVFVHWCFK